MALLGNEDKIASKENLVGMLEVQLANGLLTESEYNRLYFRATGTHNLTAEQERQVEVSVKYYAECLMSLEELGLITELKRTLLIEKSHTAVSKAIYEGKELNENGKIMEE